MNWLDSEWMDRVRDFDPPVMNYMACKHARVILSLVRDHPADWELITKERYLIVPELPQGVVDTGGDYWQHKLSPLRIVVQPATIGNVYIYPCGRKPNEPSRPVARRIKKQIGRCLARIKKERRHVGDNAIMEAMRKS